MVVSAEYELEARASPPLFGPGVLCLYRNTSLILQTLERLQFVIVTKLIMLILCVHALLIYLCPDDNS